ncbi:hypothetical protein [Xanthomonas sp. D-109]|uniref:hypothetical protein n=1 Tax=Xanthomonas sp. D-109 TaxID=2821274 RepID=UPI001ADCD5CB|nr:hypothetical protein [Xanthomonas sp. D-109]MBO9881466.1 hypothetical protein [Xanthomonas sp. D-109]
MNTASENAANPHGDAHGDPVYRKNPHPTQAYRITMTIEDAPGPFGFVDAAAVYQMSNYEQCTPGEPLEGVWTKRKDDHIPAAFAKVDANTYATTIYTDGMVDADYYGKGICHWRINGIVIGLKATGKQQETNFSPSLERPEIIGSRSKVTYFWKGRYPKEDMDDFQDIGQRNAEDFDEETRNNLFKVTLKAERVAP